MSAALEREFTPANSSSALALVLANLAVDPTKHNSRERVLYAEVQRLRAMEQRATDMLNAENATASTHQAARMIRDGELRLLGEAE